MRKQTARFSSGTRPRKIHQLLIWWCSIILCLIECPDSNWLSLICPTSENIAVGWKGLQIGQTRCLNRFPHCGPDKQPIACSRDVTRDTQLWQVAIPCRSVMPKHVLRFYEIAGWRRAKDCFLFSVGVSSPSRRRSVVPLGLPVCPVSVLRGRESEIDKEGICMILSVVFCQQQQQSKTSLG